MNAKSPLTQPLPRGAEERVLDSPPARKGRGERGRSSHRGNARRSGASRSSQYGVSAAVWRDAQVLPAQTQAIAAAWQHWSASELARTSDGAGGASRGFCLARSRASAGVASGWERARAPRATDRRTVPADSPLA